MKNYEKNCHSRNSIGKRVAQSSKKIMKPTRLTTLFIALPLLLGPALTGCSGSSESGETVNKIQTEEKKKSALPVSEPSFPGTYKTVEMEGVEMRQGRFPVGKFGGTLVRDIVASDPKTFNPWVSTDSTSSELGALMFASLLTTDMYNGEIIPYMAESFVAEEDGITYTTRLRKGLTWSDGKPITAADVAFTWNTIIAGGYGNSSMRDVTSVDGQTPRVTVIDELTNQYVTARPFAPFARVIGDVPVAPKHIIEPLLAKKDGRKQFNNFWGANLDPKTLVTSGPFTLKRFVPSQRVEFQRTENFFMVNKEGKRLPYLDRVVYLITPNVQTHLLKFRNKEVDVAQIRSRDTVELMKVQDKENFKLYNLGQGLGSTFAIFNMNRRSDPKTKKPYVIPAKAAWFNDLNFRQAVNHAMPRESIVQAYFKGLGYPDYFTFSPSSTFFNSELKSFKVDVPYAMELLSKSGFKKNEKGELLDKDGNRVEFDVVTGAGGTYMETVGNMFVEQMKSLGIKANFQQVDFNILIDKMNNSLKWECALFSLTGGDPFEPNSSANVFRSDGRLHLFDQRLPGPDGKIEVTDARPWEKRIDELLNEGAVTMEKDKRKVIYDEFQKLIYDEAPMMYIADAMTIVGARKTLGNFEPTQLSQLNIGIHNIEEIYKEE